MKHSLETIVSRAKRRGFVYPGSAIYGGLANAWDYGPYGVLLKKNIQDIRRKTFVQEREDMIGLDSQILMHPHVREASGHVGNFNDPLIDDKNTGERFRADTLIQEKLTSRIQEHGQEEVVQKLQQKYNITHLTPETRTLEQMHQFILQEIPYNPHSNKKADWTSVRKFNMMFFTYQGVFANEENKLRLRPETAQGIFVNFKNILDTTRVRIPFGIAQIGKAFRNEITPGNFLFRTREFEQMEIEYFVPNDTMIALEHFTQRKQTCLDFWLHRIGIKPHNIRARDQEKQELAHYSQATTDIEYHFPRGWGELQGLSYRTDFDLRQHQSYAGVDLHYHDPQTGKRYIPHVIEPSFGLSRTVLAVLSDAYDEENYIDTQGIQQTRVVARFIPRIAPITCCVIPLIKKNTSMVHIARNLYQALSKHRMCEYDDSGNIGKCYRRQDEIGTPYCITIDHQTIQDNTITIRDRDTMQQKRFSIQECIPYLREQYLKE